jgi:RsiW-degrading membrane proteinase PrsW (M82 family)
MKSFNWDRTWVGLVLGILTPVIVYSLYYLLVYDTGIKKMNISLCIATNLIPFYIYQRKERYNGLKGVLISTFIWAGLVIFLTLFTNYLQIGR